MCESCNPEVFDSVCNLGQISFTVLTCNICNECGEPAAYIWYWYDLERPEFDPESTNWINLKADNLHEERELFSYQ